MSLQRRHNKLQYTKQELLEAVMDNRMSRQDYVEKKKILLADEENIAAKLAVLQQKFEELSTCNEQTEQKRETAKEITQYNGISELTPKVMKALVKRVVIYPDKHIRIEWNFPDNMIPFTRKVN